MSLASCERFQTMSVADDPLERREAARHAASCAACAEQLSFDASLAGEIQAWKDSAPEPPERLRRRIDRRADVNLHPACGGAEGRARHCARSSGHGPSGRARMAGK